MKFIDSHIHLQDYKANNAQQIVEELKSKDFAKVIAVSSNEEDWEKVAFLAENNKDFVIPAFGLHPWQITKVQKNWQQRLTNWIRKFPQAIIGECGLDRLKAPCWEGQTEAFAFHCELAKQYHRPLNIHVLRAENDFRVMLNKMPEKFVLHSYGGSNELLKQSIDAGGYISWSAALLKRKNAVELINATPLSRILTESDAPYQTSYEDIPSFLKYIAEIKKIDRQIVAETIVNNFFEFIK